MINVSGSVAKCVTEVQNHQLILKAIEICMEIFRVIKGARLSLLPRKAFMRAIKKNKLLNKRYGGVQF